MTPRTRRGLLRAVLVPLVAGALTAASAAVATGSTGTGPTAAAANAGAPNGPGAVDRSGPAATRRSYTGTIGGADYRVEVPDRWNGTLVLFSHGYYVGYVPEQIALANRAETANWLLDHGYALAASNFEGTTGYLVEHALRDQIALLDWFEANVGRPRRTIAAGQSLGATISVLLAERHPRRFDGVATLCGEYDPNGTFNMALDITFAIKVLLAPDAEIDLVRARDPQASAAELQRAVQRAATDKGGPARLALIGALGNIPGWYNVHEPEPTDPADWGRQQASWLEWAYAWGMGPTGRADLEPRAGGNPSWNVGIDYGRQLARSAQRDRVRQAYRDAGLDLDADLARLAKAPRIAADPRAAAYMYRYGVPVGRTPAPVLSLHNTKDGGAVADQERWYAAQVRRAGDPDRLRQLYVERGGHCAFSAAEEITALRALFARVDTGRWPELAPDRLNAAAGGHDEPYQRVLDLVTLEDRAMTPAFVRYAPPAFLRPSR
ncbi:alpha/beta hydrolase-fold protein [Micromonospora sp. NPDC049559]|uniref:alpha/beta hydrolase family protein n=1 Tax=Micromonospora sp. NPDC049559 TaxID=3155923 RepID=UPI003418A1E6